MNFKQLQEKIGKQSRKDWEQLPKFSKAQTMWAKLSESLEGFNIKTFKREQNYKLALHNPATSGEKYLKTLIYNLASDLDALDWRRLGRIKNREVGNPISINFNGQDVDLDYIQAILELKLILKYVHLSTNAAVLEIGAGYGRTCHALMSNVQVGVYVIIDLQPALELAKAYLVKVLPIQDYMRISFVPVGEKIYIKDFDLALNIDSFFEMDKKTVKKYLKFIDHTSQYFYCKNQIGFEPKQTGISYRLRQAINSKLKPRQSTFLKTYKPGKSWTLAEDSWAKPFPTYWQALYGKGAIRILTPIDGSVLLCFFLS